ncbi:hypothetical protein B0H11DRAFT_2194888 [Mycena galericulata]|nr:hypothetical protein B0H11DRAFT_2194888 [Mycena galericulata]
MSFSVRHIPALVAASLTFGGLIPFSTHAKHLASPTNCRFKPRTVGYDFEHRARHQVIGGHGTVSARSERSVYNRDIRLRARVFLWVLEMRTKLGRFQPVLVAKERIVPLISLYAETGLQEQYKDGMAERNNRKIGALQQLSTRAVRVAVNRTNMGTLPLHPETALREQHEDGVAKKRMFFANTFIFGAIEQEYRHFNNFRTRVVLESRVNRGSAWWDNTAKCGDKEDRHREL